MFLLFYITCFMNVITCKVLFYEHQTVKFFHGSGWVFDTDHFLTLTISFMFLALEIFFQVVPIDIANDAVTTADYKVHLKIK